MKQIKDLPKDWALYLGDKSMPKWKEALNCCNKLRDEEFFGNNNFYTIDDYSNSLNSYKKTLTPEEFSSHFEIEPTIEYELAAMRYELGDTIKNNDYERKVLGVCGLVYFISKANKLNEASNSIYTQKELDDLKYKKKL